MSCISLIYFLLQLCTGLGEHDFLPILRVRSILKNTDTSTALVVHLCDTAQHSHAQDAWLNSESMVGIPALDGAGGQNIIPTIHGRLKSNGLCVF